VRRLRAPGAAVCLTSPTGGGKTSMMTELLSDGGSAVLYSNRRWLLSQTSKALIKAGLDHGIRAAGVEPQDWHPIQLSSIQTELSRCLRRGGSLHRAELVLVDEAHANKEATMAEIIKRHKAQGAYIVGVTATPLELSHLYDLLVVAGTTSELRACGALLPAKQYAPTYPDLRHVKRTKTGEYTYKEVVRVIMTHSIFGNVLENWGRLNPDGRPTLLFAPGVKESLWFAEQFWQRGISAAHIDGKELWINGETFPSNDESRAYLRQEAEEGRVTITCNRFVMREGIDWPFLYHAIFATCYGSLTAFIQSGGRLLRNHPGMDHVIAQDHGGNFTRHGSLNADRDWPMDQSDYQVGELRLDRIREKKEPEPITCPKCFAMRLSGPTCYDCGFEYRSRSRMVMQVTGELKEVIGPIYRSHVMYKKEDAAKQWERCYWSCYKRGKTFREARGLFAYHNHFQVPPNNLPLMPTRAEDWFAKVKDIPFDKLTEGPGKKERLFAT
jgi:superfamily II DNA or RNA helicase